MSKKKKSKERASGPFSKIAVLFSPPWRRFTLFTMAVVGLVVAGSAVWPKVHQRVMHNDNLWLRAEAIEITPLPPWIRGDVRGEVLRDASLDGAISILDPALAQRVAEAFALHPWVEEVVRVQKHHPAHVSVEIKYRRPACMVRVSGRLFPTGPGDEQIADGLYPVDAKGIFLPPDDFSPIEAARYPRLVGTNSIPVGPPGTRWGDTAVQEGARVAAVLVDDWRRFDIERIEPAVDVRRNSDILRFDLITNNGTRIRWGSAPQDGPAGEAVTQEKLRQLDRYADEHGSLDVPDPPREINLQPWDAKLDEEPFTADRRGT